MMRKNSSVKSPEKMIRNHKGPSLGSAACRSHVDYAVSVAVTVLVAAVLAGCSSGNVQSRRSSGYYGPRLVGSRNRKLNSRESALGSSRIVASWYGPGYEGRRTANGENFDPQAFSAASKTLPLGSIVRVTNIKNGRWVDVRINDRGPVAPGRSIDLSPAAAKRIGLTESGVAHVKVTRISNQAEAKVTH
jgi:peptidoglycan lytic transglycosylase